jgi:hypothetical protein
MRFCTNLMSLIFILLASVIMAVRINKVCAINNSAVNFILSVQAVQEYCDSMA